MVCFVDSSGYGAGAERVVDANAPHEACVGVPCHEPRHVRADEQHAVRATRREAVWVAKHAIGQYRSPVAQRALNADIKDVDPCGKRASNVQACLIW